MGLITAWICLLYFIPVLIQCHFEIEDAPAFINNAAFLISTALVATASAFFSQRLRRETFRQHALAEEASIRTEKSIQETHEATLALEMRDEFISIASHELKTPITVLKLQNDLLARSLSRLPLEREHTDSFQKHFARSNGQLSSLIRLINDMLDLSRINAGKMVFNRDHFVVGEIIQEVVERLQSTLDDNGIRLQLDLQDDVVGYVDRMRLEQVLMNLITNAAKYAPDAPLRISLKEEGDRAIIEVEDHGPGIPEGLRLRVFDRFERGDSNHKIGGLGLGLYIARQIVWGLGGEIDILGREGSGAYFRINIPLNDEPLKNSTSK